MSAFTDAWKTFFQSENAWAQHRLRCPDGVNCVHAQSLDRETARKAIETLEAIPANKNAPIQ